MRPHLDSRRYLTARDGLSCHLELHDYADLVHQGGGAGTNDEWDNKLVASLVRELGPGYELRYPRMPNEGEPRYAAWKTALEGELAGLDEARS